MICFFNGEEERECFDEAFESETDGAVDDLGVPS